MTALTNQQNAAAAMLNTVIRNKRDPHLSSCLCPQAVVACECLLMLE